MRISKQLCIGIIAVFIAGQAIAYSGPGKPADLLPERIATYEADMEDLEKVYIFKDSPEYYTRMREYNKAVLASLRELRFDSLSVSDQVDYLLFQRTIRHSLQELDQAQKVYEQVKFAIPFAQKIMDLQIRRRRGAALDGEATAQTLDSVKSDIRDARQQLDKQPALSRALTQKIVDIITSVRKGLENTYTFYDGYDPTFTWWVKKPYHEADSLLSAYGLFLQAKMTGDNRGINPIGEDKLKELLEYEMVPYGPQDLVDIANRQFAWCEKEMKKASSELGFGPYYFFFELSPG